MPETTLTRTQINFLLEQERRKGKTFHFARDTNGTLVRVSGKPPTGGIGSFQGKLGTPVRSKKGRTYRKGNGYTHYIIPWDEPVVMY